MKNLLLKLTKKLEDKGLTLNLTGKQLMKELGISKENLNEVSISYNCDIYDYYQIACSTKYLDELKKHFTFNNGITLYNDNDEVGSSLEGNSQPNANFFVGDLFRIKTLDYYSDSLVNIVNILSTISSDEPISLSLQFQGSYYVYFNIQNGNVKNVEYEEYEVEDELALFYQLLIISYNVAVKETLSLLQLLN